MTEFADARLGEDETIARAAWWPGPSEDQPLAPPAGSWWTAAQMLDRLGATGDAAHAARHSPKRVLAQAAALRLILAAHQPVRIGGLAWCQTCISDRTDYREEWGGDEWPCATARALDAIWADHPEYRRERS